jgi:hypothetical protein
VNEFDETEVVTADTVADRDPRVILLAALAAVVIGGLLWFMVVSPLLGSDDVELAAVPAASVEPADEAGTVETDTVDATAEEVAAELPLVTYEVFLDRDPFDPVVPEPVAATAPTSETGGEPSEDGTDPTAPTDPNAQPTDPAPVPTPVPDGTVDQSGGCVAGEQLVCNGRVLSLIEIRTTEDGERVAIIQVDTTIYEVGVGETFAGNFRVQSITEDQVLVQYGDDVDRLDVGDRVLK